jgi:hypothetical protein
MKELPMVERFGGLRALSYIPSGGPSRAERISVLADKRIGVGTRVLITLPESGKQVVRTVASVSHVGLVRVEGSARQFEPRWMSRYERKR